MSATGYTTGDPQKVDVTGDTMTGDLTLSGGGTDLAVGGNLSVSGSSSFTGPVTGTLNVAGVLQGTYQGIPASDVVRLLSTALSTGVVSGGDLSPNAGDNTKLDITATTGWVVDYDSAGVVGAGNPELTYVSLAAQTALTPTVGVPTGVTWWLVDSSGTLVQQTAAPTPEQRRTHMVLGVTGQASGVIVTAQSLPVIQSQPANQLVDLIDALGAFRISGAEISANGANLTMALTEGRLFTRAFSHIPDYLNPHHSHVGAQAPMQFRHITAVAGSAGALRTTLDVGNYDPNGAGVLTAVPGGANAATNFRVWAFGTDDVNAQILIQYGQNSYASLDAAQAAIGGTRYTVHPTALSSGVLLGWVTAIRTATDLSNTSQARFTPTTAKFPNP